MEDSNYGRIKGKTAEEILATVDCSYAGPIGEYLRIAAQVRTNQELTTVLTQASTESGNLQKKIVVLTIVLALAAIGQAVATSWPYLSSWWKH